MTQPKHDFHLPRRTRWGAIILLALLLLTVFGWRILPSLIQPKADKEEAALQQSWSHFEKEHVTDAPEHANYYSSDRPYKKKDWDDDGKEQKARKGILFSFNPNTASEADLLKLGLPKYTVQTILKYRAKSATTFKRKEDLQRLYTLSEADYNRIAPYVNIPEMPKVEDHLYATNDFGKPRYPLKNNEPKEIELNAATADELMSLRGIGPGYSKRIINFRDALGGFISVDQLKEVYGFPDSTFQQLKDKFTVNVTLVKHININIADEATLAKDPYIGRKLAAGIIKLRNDLKQFKEIEDLRQVPLLNEEKYRKIAPYLSTH